MNVCYVSILIDIRSEKTNSSMCTLDFPLVMILRMAEVVEARADELGEGEVVDLMEWVRHTLTLGVSTAMYGPKNPYHSRECEDAFW